MATDTNRQVTAADIKGDLAQRLRCPGCTRTFAQVEGRNKVELDRKETMEGGRHAITFVCNECKENNRDPVFAFRLVGGLIQEVRIEDFPIYPHLSQLQKQQEEDKEPIRAGDGLQKQIRVKDQTTAAEPIAPE